MVYAVSDLHGYSLEKLRAHLDEIGFTKDDFLYVLGDVIDRGTDSIKLLKWLMSKHNAQLIFGNHEAMMLSCSFLFDTITEEAISRLTGEKLELYSIWCSNGGHRTLDLLSGVRDKEIQYILEYLRESPLYETLTVGGRDFLLTHSGLGSFDKNKKLSEYSSADFIWNRPQLTDRYFDHIITVFGHTPTVYYGMDNKGKIIRTDTWIDIDVGTGMGMPPAILRLDDLEVFYFDE